MINRTENQKLEDCEKYEKLKKKAEDDFDKLTLIFSDWDNNEILKNSKEGKQKSLKDHLKEKFKLNNEDYKNSSLNDVDDSGGSGLDQKVSSWSEGCQVIYGGQHFYEFLFYLVQYVEESNQERWYYTIVDIDTISGVVKGEPILTEITEENK